MVVFNPFGVSSYYGIAQSHTCMDVYWLLLWYYSVYTRPSNRDGTYLNACRYKQESQGF